MKLERQTLGTQYSSLTDSPLFTNWITLLFSWLTGWLTVFASDWLSLFFTDRISLVFWLTGRETHSLINWMTESHSYWWTEVNGSSRNMFVFVFFTGQDLYKYFTGLLLHLAVEIVFPVSWPLTSDFLLFLLSPLCLSGRQWEVLPPLTEKHLGLYPLPLLSSALPQSFPLPLSFSPLFLLNIPLLTVPASSL